MIQGAIRLPPRHEPEPDACVVRGNPKDYAHRHPAAKDVISVIEVADSSLLHDRTTKLRVYAAGAIRRARERVGIAAGSRKQVTVPACILLP